ncbi:hypothetical protein R1flu_024910 [Riccia fluitans]|uniref:Uncharacterized protein n=1 Tax=Riccia fluitans TaxID=41844 RepID=A0ABD1XX64_9MARC
MKLQSSVHGRMKAQSGRSGVTWGTGVELDVDRTKAAKRANQTEDAEKTGQSMSQSIYFLPRVSLGVNVPSVAIRGVSLSSEV